MLVISEEDALKNIVYTSSMFKVLFNINNNLIWFGTYRNAQEALQQASYIRQRITQKKRLIINKYMYL